MSTHLKCKLNFFLYKMALTHTMLSVSHFSGSTERGDVGISSIKESLIIQQKETRGPADRDQGGDEGGRSQGRDRRDPEQEEHSRTQTTAMVTAHSGVAMEEEWPPTPGGRPTAAEQVDGELEVDMECQ